MDTIKNLLFFVLLLHFSCAHADATYYVSRNGSDSFGDGSSSNEWGSIQYGISQLSSGDTLIIRDGVYSGKLNFISNIPSGQASQYTRVIAEHPFKVRVESGQGLLYDEYLVNLRGQYVHVDGFIFNHKDSRYPPFTGNIYGSYLKLTRSIFRREGEVDAYGGWLTVGGAYNLVEDTAGVGGARYGFSTGGPESSDSYIIFRRVVGRLDYADTNQPKSTFVHYGHNSLPNSHHIIFQNVIALDSNQPGYTQGFFGTKNGGIKAVKTAVDDVFTGCIVLNEDLEYQGIWIQGHNNTLENSIIWGNQLGEYGSVAPVAYNIDSGFLGAPHNSVVKKITAGNNQDPSKDNVQITEQQYLPLSDNSSNATILKRIGVTGTLYGEPGWDLVTDEDLWPWLYEDEIKAVFSEDNPTPYGYTPFNNNAKRGFAVHENGLYGGEVTLTSYIWEYLGNPCPTEICSKDPVPPSSGNQLINDYHAHTGKAKGGSLSIITYLIFVLIFMLRNDYLMSLQSCLRHKKKIFVK